ncbi:MAG: S46 family peptidase [Bacteroidota bacterium]|nr:S46 family peptidase [Bacteroidota bacterium]MDP4190008.1 S46 family peptidase [Bacteroidota bacterium]MDP4193440.1 S46 family peptidase [Bacteroidota bacterium]
MITKLGIYRNKVIFPIVILSMTIFLSAWKNPDPEEGMYPLSEIRHLALKEAGLKIDPVDIYNPKGISLIDALVNVGGCTGSFVSEKGLIITNHHCVFGALQAASTVEHDYIENGFIARTHEEEIEAKGMTCQITESYEDVSEKILKAVSAIKDPAERLRAIEKEKKELVRLAEDKDRTIKAEVSEMFEGKTYILFKYKEIKDVRIVYVPPRSIGEFGGESDNWIWPRHTGDFSFLRAYVSKDGKSASYSKDNVPFKPKRYLKVNANGVDENDFVFILGYPGRTFRHKPSEFLEYQEKYQLPYISKLYDFQIETMQKMGENNHGLEIRLASRIKGLSNVTKNYKGKLKGLRELALVEKKKAEENELQAFIDSDKQLKSEYGSMLSETAKIYQEMFKNAKRDLWYGQIYRSSTLLRLSSLALDYAIERKKPDSERKSAFKEKNISDTRENISVLYGQFSIEADKIFFKKMLEDAAVFTEDLRVEAVDKVINRKQVEASIDDFIDRSFSANKLTDQSYFMGLLEKSYEELERLDNPIIKFDLALRKQLSENDNKIKTIEGKLDELSAKLIEVKRLWKKQSFIPDANSTLRLTYGHIKGYSPSDAVYLSPITTLKGVIEKSFRGGEYNIPKRLRELYDKKDYGKFYSKKIDDLPVAILYDTDTSGGNSGSPIMNAYGELIGVNYDRTYEATINDYAWNENYSRSIGVDIRYVLWVTQKIGGADFILNELGIKL